MHQSPIQQHKAAANEHDGPQQEGKGKSLTPPTFQLKASEGPAAPPPAALGSKSGGLPSDLVSGFAASTGHDLSDVNVVRNSDKPAQVGALAYAQGNDIHLAAGQEQHLAHEAAHIVQQREGRVQATTQVGGMAVNDSKSLESEADSMGAKAMQMKSAAGAEQAQQNAPAATTQRPSYTKQLKRKLREDYPWEGVITGASHVNFRSSAEKDPADPKKNVIGVLAEGTRAKVHGKSSNWLSVEAISKRGFVHETLVDDLVANTMNKQMVGEERTWYPSGPGPNVSTDFVASALDSAVPMPTVGAAAPTGAAFTAGTANSSLNCWEIVLLAAYQVGLIDWQWLNDLYHENGADYETAWIAKITSGGAKTYLPGDPKTPRPASGDIVFFDNLSHVALATGEMDGTKSKVYSFWPPADMTPADIIAGFAASDATVMEKFHHGKVEVTTIEALSGWIAESDKHPEMGGSGAGNAPTVTFYSPSW